jgi:hypothetical protein
MSGGNAFFGSCEGNGKILKEIGGGMRFKV